MKKYVALLVGLICVSGLNAQSFMTLDSCYQRLERNYPLMKNAGLISELVDLKIKNLNTNYMPSLKLGAQASWQSDVTQMFVDNPVFIFETPEISQDQYKVYLELSQVIWDGGQTKAVKEIDRIASELDLQNLKTNVYTLRKQVVDLYFSILSMQESINVLELNRSTLRKRISEVESLVENDMLLQESLDELVVAEMQQSQKVREAYSVLKSLNSMLELLTGEEIPEMTEFLLPAPEFNWNYAGSSKSINKLEDLSYMRPELESLNLSRAQLQAGKKTLSAQRMPVLAAFAQAGYGRPGLNMLSNDFDTYAIAGLKLSWSPWHWNRISREQQMLDIKVEQIENQRKSMLQGFSIEAQSQLDKVYLYDEMILDDEKIIELREAVTKSREVRLRNADITSGDYIEALNQESLARVQLEMHQIELAKAKVEFLRITGQ